MKAILFDLDGVFYEGDRAISGAAKVVDWVEQNRIPHLFLTNTTSKPRSALVDKLAGFGISTDTSHILTPPVAAVNWLQHNNPKGKLTLFVPEATKEEFAQFDIAEHDEDSDIGAVIVGDLGERWDFPTLNHAFRLLMREPKPQFIALGLTRYWKAEDGLRLDVGAFIGALQQASGATPIVTGKPAKAFYQSACEILHVKTQDTIMIGDDIKGDIEGAQSAGLKALIVKTGKFKPRDLTIGITPDGVMDSVCDLPDWWMTDSDQ